MSRVADAALAVMGVPFRLHGREPESGLDCVGLAAWALRAGGWVGVVPTGYRLRGGDAGAVAALLDAGLARGNGAAGDVLLMRTGPGQLHLGVMTAAGLVHADAGLGRVVLRPGAVAWPVIGAWRVRESGERLVRADSSSPCPSSEEEG